MLNDCTLDDIDMKYKECSGIKRPVRIYYKSPHLCTKGITVPSDDITIPCDIITHSWLIYPVMIFVVIDILVSFIVFILLPLNRKYVFLSFNTQVAYILVLAIGYIVFSIAIVDLSVTETNSGCWVGIYFYYFGSTFIATYIISIILK